MGVSTQPTPLKPALREGVFPITKCTPVSNFLVFEESGGLSRPYGCADDFEVVPRDLSQVKRHEVVVLPRLWLGIIKSWFLIFGNSGDDAAVVAGFASDVAKTGDVVRAFARLLEFVGAGAGVAGNSGKTEFRPEFDFLFADELLTSVTNHTS